MRLTKRTLVARALMKINYWVLYCPPDATTKNKLLKKNKIEKVSALNQRIGKLIIFKNTQYLSTCKRGTRELWEKVNRLRGKIRGPDSNNENINSELLNSHYAAISTDNEYKTPAVKTTGNDALQVIDETIVFHMLDKLKKTSAGLDGLPHWFLKVAAPVLSEPICHLFNLCI